jgi:hypothetical protein
VRPTSAVLRYAGENIDPITAGGELAVGFVLDGRIKVLGSRIRVSLQLLNVETATSVWANKFDEQFTDALELEDSISRRAAEAVLPQLTETERQNIRRRGTDNAQAFEAYLRGRYYWNQFTSDSLPKALASFQKAVDIDADYALAYVGLADFYTWAGIYGIIPETAALPNKRRGAPSNSTIRSAKPMPRSVWSIQICEIGTNANGFIKKRWSLIRITRKLTNGTPRCWSARDVLKKASGKFIAPASLTRFHFGR